MVMTIQSASLVKLSESFSRADLFLSPSVLETYGLVEDEVLGSACGVNVEITDSLELEVGEWLHCGCIFLDVAVFEDCEGLSFSPPALIGYLS